MERLSSEELRWEQEETFASPRMHYGPLARFLFVSMDLLYGRKRSLSKFSYLLNAHFEDHAEHEYMEYVAQTPALESEPFESIFAEDYGKFASLADLFRQIGYDERVHKLESLNRIEAARFQ